MLLVAQKIPSGKVWTRSISKIDQNKIIQNENKSLRGWKDLFGDVHFAQNNLRMRKPLSSKLKEK